MIELSRRCFLGAAGAFAALGPLLPRVVRPHTAPVAASVPRARWPGDALPGWFDRPMRWAQLTLVENDPGTLRSAVLARLLQAAARGRRARSVPAGSSPTTRPRSRCTIAALGSATSDPFGTLVAGCRALGMHVIARTDPHAAREEVRVAHPDWIAVTADGQPRRHWANPDLWVTCALGPYNFEFMDHVHREIVTKYQVDGIFANRWAPQGGDCYCVHCQAELQGGDRARPAADDRRARSGPPRSSSNGARRG